MKHIVMMGILISGFYSSKSQERITSHNNDLWFLLHGNYYFSEKFGFDSEAHLRLSDLGYQKQQILLRPSVYYKFNDKVKFYLGYTYINTYPYGDQPIAARTPENNLWIQASVSQKLGQLGLSHRYRLEQRWVGKMTLGNNGFELTDRIHKNRIRYRITAKFRIPTDQRFYFTAFDEVWINYGKNTGLNYLDQNWMYGGGGFYFNEETAIELAYMWQLVKKSDGIREESNNTLQLSLHYNLPLKK
ncbi:MAG: hypothetical protein ACJA2S_002212 [Cyclobacteriaceae bacterium]|jgi:hypothetical protein